VKMPSGFVRVNEEVYVADGNPTIVTDDAIAFLKSAAAENRRGRARLCAHPGNGDALHEMLIAHTGGAYVQPHKHRGKSESFHIIEGRLKIFLFGDDATWEQTIQMAPPGGGGSFFYRLHSETFHSVLPETDFVVFHEVTNGPFDVADRIDADWAPTEDGDPELQTAFIKAWLDGAGLPAGADRPGVQGGTE
jgi:cupin fold WbuC family metalloprotein